MPMDLSTEKVPSTVTRQDLQTMCKRVTPIDRAWMHYCLLGDQWYAGDYSEVSNTVRRQLWAWCQKVLRGERA